MDSSLISINRFLSPPASRSSDACLANFVNYDLSSVTPPVSQMDFGPIPMFKSPLGYYNMNDIPKLGNAQKWLQAFDHLLIRDA